jgi:hypothetical protein
MRRLSLIAGLSGKRGDRNHHDGQQGDCRLGFPDHCVNVAQPKAIICEGLGAVARKINLTIRRELYR